MKSYNYSIAFDHKRKETIPYLDIQFRNKSDVVIPALFSFVISFVTYIIIDIFSDSIYMKLSSLFVFIIIFGIGAKAFTTINPETKTAKGREYIVRNLKKNKVILLDNKRIDLDRRNANMRRFKIGGWYY